MSCCKPVDPFTTLEGKRLEILRELENVKHAIIRELSGVEKLTPDSYNALLARIKAAEQSLCDKQFYMDRCLAAVRDISDSMRKDWGSISGAVADVSRILQDVATMELKHNADITTMENSLAAAVAGLQGSINDIAGGMIPESVVGDAVTAYVNEHSAGFATADALQAAETIGADRAESGVYALPLGEWGFLSGAGYQNVFEIPEGGFSVRNLGTREIVADGKTYTISYRLAIGEMNGTNPVTDFTIDAAATAAYCAPAFTGRLYFVPGDAGRYAQITVNAVSGNDALFKYESAEYMAAAKAHCVFTGRIRSGSGVPGSHPCTVKNVTSEDFTIDFEINGSSNKYSGLASFLPLGNVDFVACNPDLWMCAKIFRIDPATRKATAVAVENVLVGFNPTYGSGCIMDLSCYDETHAAIVCFGRVPEWCEYDNELYNGAVHVSDILTIGLNRKRYESGICVNWKNGATVVDDLAGTSLAVKRNIDLLKSLQIAGAFGRFANDKSNEYFYFNGRTDFAGMMYAGNYIAGQPFYNVSPVAFYTAQLNPNSNVYGDIAGELHWGIKCAAFTSLLHGHPIPRSTFDYRYNNIPGYDMRKFDFSHGLGNLKRYDVLVQGAGHTGHCMMLSALVNVENRVQMLKTFEAKTPCTGENLYPLTPVDFSKPKPETWFPEAYDFVCIAKPEHDRELWALADWDLPYTEPQNVMCNRGYNGLYLQGETRVYLSVKPIVQSITITIDGKTLYNKPVAEFPAAPKPSNAGYQVIDITDYVNPGTVEIGNDADSTKEKFYVMDASRYTVSATIDGDKIAVKTSHPAKVKYANIIYTCENGRYAGRTAAMNFEPDFDETGIMRVPETIDTGDIGTWRVTGPEFGDMVNLVFSTDFDTNTFYVDAQNDRGC